MPEDCPPLLAVVFPAIVTSNGLSLTRAKVFIGTSQTWVALDSPTGPQLVETIDFSSMVAFGDGCFDLTESDGSVVNIKSGGGCGCGSRLRNWSPFSGPLRLGT